MQSGNETNNLQKSDPAKARPAGAPPPPLCSRLQLGGFLLYNMLDCAEFNLTLTLVLDCGSSLIQKISLCTDPALPLSSTKMSLGLLETCRGASVSNKYKKSKVRSNKSTTIAIYIALAN